MPRKKGSDKSAMQNAAKTLLANIRFASIDSPIKTVTVTSSRPNEGKTTVAAALANAAATGGRHVALVECDMRQRSMAAQIDVRGAHGLYAVASGKVSLDDAMTPTHQKNLDFLDVEPGIPNPPDVIASKRFRKLVRDLRADYDLVIFDTPPVGGFVDAAELATLTDGTLFVVRENFVKREVAADAIEQLRKAGANVLGSVLNCCELSSSGYYDYYYHETEDSKPAVAAPKDALEHEAAEGTPKHEAAGGIPEREAAEDIPGYEAAEVAPEHARKVSPSETGAFAIAAQQSAARNGSAHGYVTVASGSSAPGAPARPQAPASRAQAPLPAYGQQGRRSQRAGQGSGGPYVPSKNPYTR